MIHRAGVRGRIVAQALLELGERAGPDEVEPERVETQIHHMAVAIDQAREAAFGPTAVDALLNIQPLAIEPLVRRTDNFAIVADQQPVEVLQFAAPADLNAVDVINQRVRPSR